MRSRILPALVETVNEAGEIHYKEATTKIQKGVWGSKAKTPKTAALSVNNALTTATGPDGKKLFRRTAPGTYRIFGGKTAYNRFMKNLNR